MLYYASCIRSLKGRTECSYILDTGNQIIERKILTRGTLDSVDSVTSEQYIDWRLSVGKKDFHRMKDYKIIIDNLFHLGEQARKLNGIKRPEYMNCTPELEKQGYRRLKTFEEEALLSGLLGKSNPLK